MDELEQFLGKNIHIHGSDRGFATSGQMRGYTKKAKSPISGKNSRTVFIRGRDGQLSEVRLEEYPDSRIFRASP